MRRKRGEDGRGEEEQGENAGAERESAVHHRENYVIPARLASE
jgi:hypothetical protein